MICVLVLHCFVNSLALASNILLADMNSLSCKMFMFRLSGAQVRWRWMAALMPVNALGVNAWPFSVFTSAKNFHRISLTSVGLTVLRSNVIFLFWHRLSNFFTPHSVALLVFFAWAFCPISSSCSLSKSEFWLEKRLKIWDFFHFKITSPNVKRSLQTTKLAPTQALKWYPQDLIGRAKFFDTSSASQYQGGKCIFSQNIFRLAREMARFTEGSLSFGRAYWQ